MQSFKRILVAVDFSPASRSALEHAVALASKLDAQVDVLHAWQTPSMVPVEVSQVTPLGLPHGTGSVAHAAADKQLAEFIEAFHDPSGPHLHAELVFGPAAPVIRRKAEEGWYDLIVMGTHGRSGLSRLVLGSVAEAVARDAPCPVLTVRAPRPPAGSNVGSPSAI